MRPMKSVTALVTGVLAVGAAIVASATPAAALPSGDLLPGNIYWFNTAGPLEQQSSATQITTGSGTTRPWVTLATENACPAAAAQMVTFIRIPQPGAPEDDWPQVQMGATTNTKDSAGRYYTTLTRQADRMSKAEVLSYLQANNNTGVFPLVAVCFDELLNPVGNFRNLVTINGSNETNLSWSIDSAAYTGGGSQQPAADTTTAVAAVASGKDVDLKATVAPAAATGTVTFTDGGTTLGTAAVSGGVATYKAVAPSPGSHTYQAAFAPADAAKYKASTGSVSVTVGLDAATGEIQLTVPAAPVVDGSLTLSAPFSSPVQLAGARSQDNSRITATAAFPTVTVTDTRRDGLLSHWQVNVQSSDFAGSGSSAGTIGAKYLGWVPASSATPDAGSPLQTRNGASVASFLDDTASSGLASSKMLGESATAGRGAATLNAALNLAIPPSTAEGQYTATVTVTLVAD